MISTTWSQNKGGGAGGRTRGRWWSSGEVREREQAVRIRQPKSWMNCAIQVPTISGCKSWAITCFNVFSPVLLYSHAVLRMAPQLRQASRMHQKSCRCTSQGVGCAGTSNIPLLWSLCVCVCVCVCLWWGLAHSPQAATTTTSSSSCVPSRFAHVHKTACKKLSNGTHGHS